MDLCQLCWTCCCSEWVNMPRHSLSGATCRLLQWRDSFDPAAWEAAVAAAAAARHAPPEGVEAWGNDVHQGALGLALRDVQAAGMQPMIRLHHGECADWKVPRPPALVVANPPWGQRLLGYSGGRGSEDSSGGRFSGGSRDEDVDAWWQQEAAAEDQAAARFRRAPQQERQDRQAEEAALAATWWDLSAFLKQQCVGATAYLLSGNPEASKGLRLKADRRYPITVGGVDCRLLQYSIRGVEPAAPVAAAAGGSGAEGGGAAAGVAAAPAVDF